MKSYDDNEILYMVEENDEDAVDYLVDKYYDLVNVITKKYNFYDKKMMIEYKDLHQEGLLGLLEAINTFDKNKNVKFNTYAYTCIDNRIKSMIRNNYTNKNMMHNNAISLEDKGEYLNFYNYVFEDDSNPEEKILLKEQLKEINERLKKILTNVEYEIYILKLKGYKNEEIANTINESKRYVENRVSDINKKLKIIKREG